MIANYTLLTVWLAIFTLLIYIAQCHHHTQPYHFPLSHIIFRSAISLLAFFSFSDSVWIYNVCQRFINI
jgi:hypothetical protein